MKTPEYDIFSGIFGEGDAMWLEAVQGLGEACNKMKERAARVPGRYFIFCQTTHIVRASTDTSKRSDESRKAAS